MARAQRWNPGTHTAPPAATHESTPAKSATQTVSKAVVTSYDTLAGGMYENRRDFMEWVHKSASSTPDYLVDDRVNEYLGGARGEIDALDRASWPPVAASLVDDLIASDRTFLVDVDLL